MAADMFSRLDALNLLNNKRVFMFGDSNMRAIYKDLVWLANVGSLIPSESLKIKNEITHAGDWRLSNGQLTASRNYIEVREYNKGCLIHYEFITKLFSAEFRKTIIERQVRPDFIILNSCVWDLSRWGPNGIQNYKTNIDKTFKFLRKHCPTTCIIFTTTLPPSFKARGGFLTENVQFLRDTLPFSVVEANHYTASISTKYHIDILDLHCYLRLLIDYRTLDGIHWDPLAIRYATNIILTHLSMCTFSALPGNVPLLYTYDMPPTNENKNKNYAERGNHSKHTNNNALRNVNKRKRVLARTDVYNTNLYSNNYYQRLYDFNKK